MAPDLPALGGMLRALRGCEHLDAEGHNSLAAVLEGHLPYPVWVSGGGRLPCCLQRCSGSGRALGGHTAGASKAN